MPSPQINSDLALHKSQLNDFLSKKYVDQPLLLGFTAVVQSKFCKWIQDDIDLLYRNSHNLQNGQADLAKFELVQLLETFWTQFIHPIIKFYQRQHAELLCLLLQPKKGSKAKFKSVEMRKLNEYFMKFTKCVISFYDKVIQYVAGSFTNSLIPLFFFKELEIENSSSQKEASDSNFLNNTKVILYQCFLGLGNVTRHSAQIDISYVQPCKSMALYQLYTKNEKPIANLKEKFVMPLLYYSKCIQLFPNMTDPYNHIGVIYNSLQEKFLAVVWFSRAQLTSSRKRDIAKYNMATIFTKPWLEETYSRVLKTPSKSWSISESQIILLRILGHLFYPQAYKKPMYYDKTAVDFLLTLFIQSNLWPYVRDARIISDMLIVLMSFFILAESEHNNEASTKCGSLLTRFVVNYLKHVSRWHSDTRDNTGVLQNIRMILAFCHEFPSSYKYSKEDIVRALHQAIWAILSDEDETSILNLLIAFSDNQVPVRSYLFSEDVQFKDFVAIGSRFKDFNDDHLYKSGNVDLLYGSYYYANLKEIPSFLDNEAAQRINKNAELHGYDRKSAIKEECVRYENYLRLHAAVIFMKKLFPHSFKVDEDSQSLVLEKVEIPATQKDTSKGKRSNRKKRVKNTNDSQSSDAYVHSEVPQTKQIAASLDEIELMIAGHVSGFQSTQPSRDISTEGGLADMVNSIVSDDEGVQVQSSQKQRSSPNVSVTSRSEHEQLQTPPPYPLQSPPSRPEVMGFYPGMPQEPFAPQQVPFGYPPPGFLVSQPGHPYYSMHHQMGRGIFPPPPPPPPGPWQYDTQNGAVYTNESQNYNQYRQCPQYQR